jgi:hypothetical protein
MATTATTVVKRFDSPDEVRPFMAHGRAEVLDMNGQDVGCGSFEPGWRWSADVKPIAGTDLCQVAHLGYCLSGRMTIHMQDGSDMQIRAGDVFAIAPGHDAEVVGDETCVLLDFGEFGEYAKRH